MDLDDLKLSMMLNQADDPRSLLETSKVGSSWREAFERLDVEDDMEEIRWETEDLLKDLEGLRSLPLNPRGEER